MLKPNRSITKSLNWKKRSESDHPDTLRARGNLAYALARQGKYKEAENDFHQARDAEKSRRSG